MVALAAAAAFMNADAAENMKTTQEADRPQVKQEAVMSDTEIRHASKVVDTFYDIGVTFARQFENNSMRKLKFELRTVLRQIETP